MMGVYSSVALKIYPSLQHYNGTTEFTSFICSNDDDSYVSGGEVAWLYPNFTIMTSTPDFRIDGNAIGPFQIAYFIACVYTYVHICMCVFILYTCVLYVHAIIIML